MIDDAENGCQACSLSFQQKCLSDRGTRIGLGAFITRFARLRQLPFEIAIDSFDHGLGQVVLGGQGLRPWQVLRRAGTKD